MKEFLCVTLIAVGSCIFTGCTNPTVQCIDAASDTFRTVVDDLSSLAQQGSLDATDAKIKAATTSEARQKALTDHNQVSEQIAYLRQQYERANTILILGRTYSASKEPYIKVLLDDIKKANALVEEKNE